jgi:hypothetical protein
MRITAGWVTYILLCILSQLVYITFEIKPGWLLQLITFIMMWIVTEAILIKCFASITPTNSNNEIVNDDTEK